MRRIQPRSSAVLSENRSGAAGNFTSDDGLPAVVYHYQHPNTEKFSGKKCYSCDMDKNSRVARLLEIEREKQKALFAMSGDIIFDYDLEKD